MLGAVRSQFGGVDFRKSSSVSRDIMASLRNLMTGVVPRLFNVHRRIGRLMEVISKNDIINYCYTMKESGSMIQRV